MTIQWLGHSCFRITTSRGTTVVTDPFDETVGYERPEIEADLVTLSHDHFDHNCVRALRRAGEIASRESACRVNDVRALPFSSWHDEAQGAKRGPNTIFVLEADGQRVAHLGDLGHPLSREQLEALGPLDALLVPVGGVYTIDGVQAAQLALAAGARVTVAMHFMTPGLRFELMAPEPFERAMGIRAERRNEIDLSEGNPPRLVIPVLPQ